jgi:O-antigen/teichoic acid export membrane protein
MRLPRTGLTVNALALMAGTAITSAIGLVFWIVAARLLPPHVVGRAAATIAALTLLATIAQLNLTNVFVRLLPAAGRLGGRLVGRGYLAVMALSLLLGLGYLLSGLGASVVRGGLPTRALFVAAVPVLAIFTLQDSVLTGLRLARWVPVENVASAATRLGLLGALGAASAAGAVTVSWVAPAVLAAIAVNLLVWRHALPRRDGEAGQLPARGRLLSFVAGEWVNSLCATAALQVMPLLIVWRRGASELAYFTVPWLISAAITLLLWNVAFSLAVELLGGHGSLPALLRRTALLWGAVVLGALIVLVAGASPLLSLLGPGYAREGSALLRLVGLSVPLTAVVTFYSTLVWLDQRVWPLAGYQAAAGAMLLLVTVILLPSAGLAAPGWALLATQGAAAAVMGPLALRRLRRGRLAEVL